MNDVLKAFLLLSFSGSLLILVVLVLKRLLKNKISRQWQYYIWLIVIARLLLPFSSEINLAEGIFKAIGSTINNTTMYQPQKQFVLPSNNNIQYYNVEKEGKESVAQTKLNNTNNVIQDVIVLLSNDIWLVWLIVFFIIMVRKITIYQSFVRYLKSGNIPVCDTEILDNLSIIAEQLGINKPIELCVNPLISSPTLIGFVCPCIVIPSVHIPYNDFKYIILHELTHYKRRDMFYKWLVQITVCLHWFNPFVYIMGREINKDCEFSCDDAIISKLDNNCAQEYGKTLLNAMASVGRYNENLASVTLNENKKILKERLSAIINFKKKSKLMTCFTSILTVLLFCGFAFTGATTAKKYADDIIKAQAGTYSVNINTAEISPQGKISLGSQDLASNTKCTVFLSWTGNDKITVTLSSLGGIYQRYTITNGSESSFWIYADDIYTISVKNENSQKVQDLSGSILFEQDVKGQQTVYDASQSDNSNTQTVVYESVEMRKYDGADGFDYVHDVKINNTDKKIVSAERGMLAFDKDGNPLIIDWFGLDSSTKPSYFFLYDWDSTEIMPYQVSDIFGGWTLNEYNEDYNVSKIAFVLYCDKKITFEDGTVWNNADFENWLSTYKGKKVDVSILNNYYPFEQNIDFQQ